MSFGKRVRIARKIQELSQDELAERAGIDKGTLFKIEKDITSPTWDTVVKVTRALNISNESIEYFT